MASILPLALDHQSPSLSRFGLQSRMSKGVAKDDHIMGDWGMDIKNTFSVYVGNINYYVFEGVSCSVVAREVPMCSVAPCSLSCFMFIAEMVEITSNSSGDET